VLPAWVAETDFAIAPVIVEALHEAIDAGMVGYPAFGWGGELGEAYVGFAQRQYGQTIDPDWICPVVDVTAGVRVALDVLSEPGPLVMPLPAYAPQLAVAEVTGRERVDLVVDPDAERAEIDLDRLDALFAAGARTLLLTQPHNPWGRVFTRAELEGVRDVVVRHDARVVADEIHAPLVLPGADYVSYLQIDGTHDHAVAVVAASKAFNTPGLRCAQLVVPDPLARKQLLDAPMVRNDSWSPLGVVAAVAAYTRGDDWLDALRARLDANRTLLTELLASLLPEARMRRPEATYLAWIDLRAYGHDDPAAVALERGRVRLAPGHDYQPGLTGHVRLNFGTSPERLEQIVHRLASALTSGGS
jgi:cystathionine beta-lyase